VTSIRIDSLDLSGLPTTQQCRRESFEGFSPKEGRKIDRSLSFTTSRTGFGAVSIRHADRTSIVFTTESASGAVLCMARTISEDHSSFGMVGCPDGGGV
jgi:hypothetical protein